MKGTQMSTQNNKVTSLLIPILIAGINLVGLGLATASTKGIVYWLSKYEVGLGFALLVFAQIYKKLTPKAEFNVVVLAISSLSLALTCEIMLNPGLIPYTVLISYASIALLYFKDKLNISTYANVFPFTAILGWVLYVLPNGSAATVAMSVLGFASVGLVLNSLYSKSLRLKATAVLAIASLGITGVFVYSVGVNFEKLRTYWFAFSFLSIFLMLVILLIPIYKMSKVVKSFASVIVLLIGLSSLTFISAEADTTPRVKPVPVEETIAGNGMTGEKGAGPQDRYINVSFEECDTMNKRDCFITYFDQMSKKIGVNATLTDIVDKVKNNEGYTFPKHCHQVVHNLGQSAMQITNQDFTKAIGLDPQVCGTGYVHGLFEQSLANVGFTKTFTETNTVCSSLGMNNDFYRWTCSHILGHLMMADSMANPAAAMEYCMNIERTTNQSDCLAGGWMNFFQDDQILDYVGTVGDVKKLFEVCYGSQTGKVKLFCYQELFPAIYRVANGDDYAAGKACVDYSEAAATKSDSWTPYALNYLDRCGQGLARAVAVGSDYDYRRVPPRCLSMPKEVQNPCLTASAASIVTNTGSLDAGMSVCKFVTELRYRNFCMFWVKDSRIILDQGPNSKNLPQEGEVRVPGLAPGIPNENIAPPAVNVK